MSWHITVHLHMIARLVAIVQAQAHNLKSYDLYRIKKDLLSHKLVIMAVGCKVGAGLSQTIVCEHYRLSTYFNC